jgi:hypothetical protein
VLGDLGVAVSYRATDATGGTWLFEISGAYSSTRPGLRSSESLWRALGKASALHEARRRNPHRRDLGPLVLLTTDVPGARSAGGKALRSAIGTDDRSGPVYDAIELLEPAGTARLRSYAVAGQAAGASAPVK